MSRNPSPSGPWIVQSMPMRHHSAAREPLQHGRPQNLAARGRNRARKRGVAKTSLLDVREELSVLPGRDLADARLPRNTYFQPPALESRAFWPVGHPFVSSTLGIDTSPSAHFAYLDAVTPPRRLVYWQASTRRTVCFLVTSDAPGMERVRALSSFQRSRANVRGKLHPILA